MKKIRLFLSGVLHGAGFVWMLRVMILSIFAMVYDISSAGFFLGSFCGAFFTGYVAFVNIMNIRKEFKKK